MGMVDLTPGERAFRGWMLISGLMYIAAIPIFFFGGAWIAPIINAISVKLLPLPVYPLPPTGAEGGFWRVLGVSMMVMLAWTCHLIYHDVRRNHRLVAIILLSKSCSTGCYFLLFLYHHYLAYFVGALTDGPIFVVTLVLWYVASAGPDLVDSTEERVLLSVGEAILAHGGTLQVGFNDVRDTCLERVRKMLAAHDPVSLLATRLILRTLNWSPMFLLFARHPFLALPVESRAKFLTRLERHRWNPLRMMVIIMKAYLLIPFFDEPAAARAVGYPDALSTPREARS